MTRPPFAVCEGSILARMRMQGETKCPLIGGGRQHAWHDEALQAAGMGMQLRPVLDSKVDHQQPAGRKLLTQAFAVVEVARGDEEGRRFLQAGIMAENEPLLAIRIS